MNLYFRFLTLILKRLFKVNRIDLFDSCKTSFLVNPVDLDINFHMNNGRYLSIMDLGRVDLMLKGDALWKCLKKGYYPVVNSESIRFKKSLEVFQSFKLVTTIESWDDKDFFITQKFVRNNAVFAEGYIKGRFKQWGRKGSVPTSEIFELVGRSYTGPQLSNLALSQNAIEAQLVTK